MQRAIVAGLIIPTPEVFQVEDVGCFSRCYPCDWKVPRNLIHMQRINSLWAHQSNINQLSGFFYSNAAFTMEQDIPDYDMDSEDEKWINMQAEKLVITPLQFEEMMDRLEKSSGQTVITLNEAKSLLKQDDDFIIAVYDYWLNKRLKMVSNSNSLKPYHYKFNHKLESIYSVDKLITSKYCVGNLQSSSFLLD